MSESLKTLALEEAPYPDKAETSDASLSSPVYNRREVIGSFCPCRTERHSFSIDISISNSAPMNLFCKKVISNFKLQVLKVGSLAFYDQQCEDDFQFAGLKI